MRRLLSGALCLLLPCAASGQVGDLRIRIVEGDGAVHRPGSRLAHPLAVEITDELGEIVAGAAVSFQLPPDGPGGVFTNGLKTDVAISDANGRASAGAVQCNQISGPFRVRVTAKKGESRAGTVSRQYIGGAGAAGETAAQPVRKRLEPVALPSSRSWRKWWILAVAGGAAGAGLAFGLRGGGSSAAPAQPAPPTGISIGTPVIVIGKP